MSNQTPPKAKQSKTISVLKQNSKTQVHPLQQETDVKENNLYSPEFDSENILGSTKKHKDVAKYSINKPFEDTANPVDCVQRSKAMMDNLRNNLRMVIKYPKKVLKFLCLENDAKQKLKSDQWMDSTKMSLNKIKQYRTTDRPKFYFYGTCFLLDNILMPMMVLFATIMCLASLFVWNLYNQGYIDQSSYYQVLGLDLAIAIFFTIELVHDLVFSHSLLQDLIQIQTVMDVALIIDLYYRYFQGAEYRAQVFFYILRSIRVSKLKLLANLNYKYFQKFMYQLNRDDSLVIEDEVVNDESMLQTFVVESVIKFISGMVIQSTFFLTMDQYSDQQGYKPYYDTQVPMSFVEAAYFTIVSFSTIGYGDIYPCLWYTRMAQVLILCLNLTIVSSFLTKFIDYLFKLSPYERTYSYRDHVVLVGGITDEQLQDFLEELTQNDLVYREINGLKLVTEIKVIIVVDDEPTETQRELALYYKEQMGNEISFLKEGIFTLSKNWYSAANLQYAKILFAFSLDSDLGSARQNDQMISSIALGVRQQYPDLRLILILNSTFKDQIKNDSLYNGIEAISPFQLNDFVLASSIINPGMGTILQHLLTMKVKVIPKKFLDSCQDDKFMLEYIEQMQQEVYQFTIPKFLIGLSFKECATMLYVYGLDLSGDISDENKQLGDRKMTLFAVETSTQKMDQSPTKQRQNLIRISEQDELNFMHQDSGIKQNTQLATINFDQFDDEQYNLMSGSNESTGKKNRKPKKAPIQSEAQKQEKTKILINPQNYFLRKNDIIYVICKDYTDAKDALSFNSESCSHYIQYQINQIAIQKNLLSIKDVEGSILTMFNKVAENNHNFDQQNVDQWVKKDHTGLLVHDEFIREVFDLDEDTCGQFEGHFLIFGQQQSFNNILEIIRKYTDRPAVLFTDQPLDLFRWKQIKLVHKHKNIFFVKGDFLDLSHLAQLNIKKAFHITIMSDLGQRIFSDAVGICVARIILDNYDRSDFLIELRDHEKIQFLDKNPKFKSGQCQTIFYPAFASGNVSLTSMITGILARVIYSPNWLQFFQHLTVPNNLTHDTIKQNKSVNCLRVTLQIKQDFKYFGLLQYSFMQLSTSIIAIGVVKNAFSSQYRDGLIDKFSSEEFKEKIFGYYEQFCHDTVKQKSNNGEQETKADRLNRQIGSQTKGILKKLMGENYILSNPSFYTEIEESDGIIVLGDFTQSDVQKLTISSQSRPTLHSIFNNDPRSYNQIESKHKKAQSSHCILLNEELETSPQTELEQSSDPLHKQLMQIKNIPSMYLIEKKLKVKQNMIKELKQIIKDLKRRNKMIKTIRKEFG